MERIARNLGRAYLVSALRRIGLSRRQSVLILSQVFQAMSEALGRGEAVEFPFGRLRRVGQRKGRWRGRNTVEHQLDAKSRRLFRRVLPRWTRFVGKTGK